MRHLKKGRKFSRERSARRSLLRILLSQLIVRGRLTTSAARAKEERPRVEKLITVAKKGTLASQRQLRAELPEHAARRIAAVLAPRFKNRAGGYTRITRLEPRPSDSSERAMVEFVS
ncbi:MAG: 50S ribosomal protein L17 [Candidatus Sungbacteria bacterium RIFCSPLOWO2_01_FULL_60_25]|uniref:50S ribosomal protein L17 n=1 Tax=Candidatus Sungbacteria bacterium RIFCSPLOWO2_01_FULL_60_25 TaxID=1802281 RepID=A0A1G2LAW8_9BACT|nr:MAG: 50S ribosomal protein L17 [Candidatus Sungbacteria bacterium RIFCSPLOWO2_01_FULL_60_25]